MVKELGQKTGLNWGLSGWLIHQDNAPDRTALFVKQFLTSKNFTVMEHPPYSPNLAGSGENAEFSEGSSKNHVPKLLPAMAAPNAKVCEC
ncbi:hypothetical protein TNCV_1679191 [Trichonephila clavipes]|nr:hypothetical protein TNCV_1679191 [Trichonephila clavipes]